MEFLKQEDWSGLPFPNPENLPDPEIKPPSPMSPALAGRFFITSTTWEEKQWRSWIQIFKIAKNPLQRKGKYPTYQAVSALLGIKHVSRCEQLLKRQFSSVQSLSRVQLCDPMDCSTPGLPLHHQLPNLAQTHVCRVGDAIQTSHPLPSPSPPALSFSQHQGLFKWVSSLHQVAKVLEFQLQHQSFQWTPRTDLL